MTLQPFEEVVGEHGPTVMRVVRALLGPTDAADAWSETFLSALEAYPRLRPGSNVRGWLVTIAHRKAVDQLRANGRSPAFNADLPEPGSTGSRTADAVADAVVARTSDPLLWAALGALAFKQRAAIAYHHLAGLPYAEVGLLIESSEVAARRAAADGLANLRRTYHREEPS